MKTLIVRFPNGEEYEQLKKDAHKHEKTLSDYIRWLISKEKWEDFNNGNKDAE